MADIIKGRILPDGTIKNTVEGSISSVNHQSAAEFMKMVKQLAGGEETIIQNKNRPQEQHSHGDEHLHQGH